jgi:HPr kinase/phosphorylase
MAAEATLHASCVVVREAGILIRGASGSGKSTLARQMVFAGERFGYFASVMCDDRVRLASRNGRLLATALGAIAGKLEVRGMGLLTVPYERSAIVRLVVDLTANPPRLPEAAERRAVLCGVPIPRLEARIEPGLWRMILLRLNDPGDSLMAGQ